MSFRIIVLIALFGVVIGQGARRRPVGQQGVRSAPPPVPISQQCLDCICMGSSDCDLSQRCHNAGADAYFCGPYVISWAYWHDGGRPGDKGRASDFETCLNNKTCAEQAVRGYMKKHGKDCDRDGAVTCYDFARIHKMGPGACDSGSIDDTDFWQKFLVCFDGGAIRDDYYTFDGGDAPAVSN